jgi:glycosyltransferase involved in cell wall biosynthesis
MITYGHEKFIREAIEGVLSQKCSYDIELIIADDNSPDKTKEIVEDIIKNHPNGSWIKYTRHQENKGMMPNFIWALQQSKAEYIALCEGDDYWTDPLKLQKQIHFLEENSDYVMCYHDATGINQNNEIVYLSKINALTDNIKEELTKEDLLLCNYLIPTMSVCFKNPLAPFPQPFSTVKNGDMFLFAFLSQYGKAKLIANISNAMYRIHDGGVYSSLNDFQKTIGAIDTRIKIMTHLIDEHNLKVKMREVIKKIEWNFSYRCLRNFNFGYYLKFMPLVRYHNPIMLTGNILGRLMINFTRNIFSK